MPQPQPSIARFAVPVFIVLALGGLITWSVFRNTQKQTVQHPSPVALTGPETTPTAGAPHPTAAAADPPAPLPATPPVTPPLAQTPERGAGGAPAAPVLRAAPSYRPLLFDAPGPALYDPIGSLDPASGYEMLVRFSPTLGAGLLSVDLTHQFIDIHDTTHERVQEELRGPSGQVATPMAALGLSVNGQFVNLAFTTEPGKQVWRQTAPGAFEAVIGDDAGARVARVVREYTLAPGRYDLILNQRVENLLPPGSAPLAVQWLQYGPVDLPAGVVRYGGDSRRVRFGYLRGLQKDPAQERVETGAFLIMHQDALKPGAAATPEKTLWPNDTSAANSYSLVWTGLTNRYFAAAVHPIVGPPAAGARADKRFASIERVDRFVVDAAPAGGGATGGGTAASGGGPAAAATPSIVLRLTGPAVLVPPGGSADQGMGLYAGPLTRNVIDPEPLAEAVGLSSLVVFNAGGPCGTWCTFDFLTHGLRWFLGFLHDHVLHDWALAIMVLVVCVRTVLHPVTKWSQVNIQRFGKQMQAVGPKQKLIQEKHKDDPAKMREEVQKLMREEKVNYAGALGCLPMFLQTPVWIALYATLNYTFELRHEGAFFDAFQRVSGGRWTFLADLAEPDKVIDFGRVLWTVPMLGPLDSINVLPVILGVVFFIQQKYLTPPPSATMTPEQAQQQKIMKVVSVFLFPVLMYNAPSGLAIYFITNSTLGIFESRYIRRHFNEVEAKRAQRAAAGVGTSMWDRKGAGAKPGLFARLQQVAEEKRRQVEESRRQGGRGPGGR